MAEEVFDRHRPVEHPLSFVRKLEAKFVCEVQSSNESERRLGVVFDWRTVADFRHLEGRSGMILTVAHERFIVENGTVWASTQPK